MTLTTDLAAAANVSADRTPDQPSTIAANLPHQVPPGVCEALPPGSAARFPLCAGHDINNAVGSAVGSAVDQVAEAFAKAQVQVLQMMLTWWTKVPSPTLNATDSHSPVGWLQSHTMWYVQAIAVFGLLLAAARLVWQRRGEPAREALTGLLTLVVVTGCGVAAINLAIQAGDAYSDWIIDQAVDERGFSGELTSMASLTGPAASALAPGLMIILSVFAIISSLIQMALMLVRVAMLGLLAGLLPLGAAAAITPQGRGQLQRGMSWLIAFILYEPVAATIYAYGLRSLTTPDVLSQLSGIIMIILAVVALPALMRLITPMVSPTASSGGSAAAMGGFAGAMGARMVPAGRGGGGGAAMPSGGTGGAPRGADPAAGSASGPGRGAPGGQSPRGGGKPPGSPAGAPNAPAAAGTSAGAAGAGAAGAGAAAAGAAGAVAGAAMQAGQQVKNAAQGAAGHVTGEGGPDGSK